MANMNYCKFENTLGDLEDCRESLDESNNFDQLTADMHEDEKQAVIRLIILCTEIAEEYEGYVDI